MKIIICTLLLAALIVGVNSALKMLSHSVELATFLAVCAVVVAAELALAFAWDRY